MATRNPMTVGELIEKLKTFEPSLIVFVHEGRYENWIYASPPVQCAMWKSDDPYAGYFTEGLCSDETKNQQGVLI